jgi:hypothetical protein
VMMEVCDASMTYVEDHLDEVGGAFLPGAQWCPWDSKLNARGEIASTTRRNDGVMFENSIDVFWPPDDDGSAAGRPGVRGRRSVQNRQRRVQAAWRW